ncbi:vWA domain-containing protein [Kamptonema cortianum]|nr:vWA domain-containing protein [Geitlerinema splendidum]MDK3156149.1 vWA domain-containing protein [Kamptonema cortianum]
MTNPWVVRLTALGGLAGVAFLCSATINLAANPNVYQEPSREGVLMPQAIAKEKLAAPVADQTPSEASEQFQRRLRFRVPSNDIEPMSFVSLSDGTAVQVVSVVPVKETKVDDRGRSVMVLIDNSYSMIQNSPPSPWNRDWLPRSDPEYKRIDAVNALINEMGEKDRMALALFPRLNRMPGRRVPRVEPPALVQNFGPPNALKGILEEMRGKENSGTPLYRVLGMSIGWLSTQGDRSKIVVMLTDGRDTEGDGQAPAGLREQIEAAGIQVFVVALGPAADIEGLSRVADEVLAVQDSSEVVAAFQKLAEKIETLIVGYDVELQISRAERPFEDDEDVQIGFRSKGLPEKMTVRVGGQQP